MIRLEIPAAAMIAALGLAQSAGAMDRTACNGIDRDLPKSRAVQLSARIDRQFSDPNASVVQSFRYRDWTIIYVDFTISDSAFVFYHGDPMRTRYVTTWGGAAAEKEEYEIRLWTLKNARGIPKHLAACFAWHVTKDRDM